MDAGTQSASVHSGARFLANQRCDEEFPLTENEITDLGCQSNKDVIRRFISLKGLHVLDVGCGNMGFTRQLTEAGATVLGIDPDPRQAEKNRAAAAEQGMQFEQAGAEAMPVADQVFDGVFFAYSLHHIPEGLYGDVFSEVARVLKPDGFVYVIEPIDCPLNQVMRHFHNEDRERAAAQRALRDLAAPGLDGGRYSCGRQGQKVRF